jgi:hypothetical protein
MMDRQDVPFFEDNCGHPPIEPPGLECPALGGYVQPMVFPTVTQDMDTDFAPIQQARDHIAEALRGGCHVVFVVSPGVGKTWAATSRIVELEQDETKIVIVYAIPTNNFAAEVTEDIRRKVEHIENARVVRYESRNEANCERYQECKKMMNLKRSPFLNVCMSPKKYGGEWCMKQEPRCPYLSQLDDFRSGVVVCTHAAVPYVLDKLRGRNVEPNIIICDESPTMSGGIVSTESMRLKDNPWILSDNALGSTRWWQLLRQGIEEAMDHLDGLTEAMEGKPHAARIELGPDAGHLADMTGDIGYEAHVRRVHEHDRRVHEKDCEQAGIQVRERNAEIKKINKIRMKEHGEKLKQSFKERKKFIAAEQRRVAAEGVMVDPGDIVCPPEPVFEPVPDVSYAEPAWKSTNISREEWEQVTKTFTARDGQAYRKAGITSQDLSEAMDKLQELEDAYTMNGEASKGDGFEWEFARKALRGEADGYAYAQLSKQINAYRDENGKEQLHIENVIELKVLRRKNWDIGKARLIILDATADHEELEAAFRLKLQKVEAMVAPVESKMVHFIQSLGSMKAKETKIRKDVKYVKHLLKMTIKELVDEDRKVVLLTHKTLKDGFPLIDMARQIDPDREYVVMHFFSGRGTNQYEDFDAVIALGTPYLSPIESEPLSLELFEERNERWMGRKGLEELVQCLHRVRPVNSRSTIIVVGQHFPTESLGRPTLVIDCQKQGARHAAVEKAAEMLIPLAREHGCLTREMADVAGVIDERDLDEQAEYREREGQEPTIYPHKEWSTIIKRVSDQTGQRLGKQRRLGVRGTGLSCCGSKEAVRAWSQSRGLEWDEHEWIFAV